MYGLYKYKPSQNCVYDKYELTSVRWGAVLVTMGPWWWASVGPSGKAIVGGRHGQGRVDYIRKGDVGTGGKAPPIRGAGGKAPSLGNFCG